jgi:molecular chaperone HscB
MHNYFDTMGLEVKYEIDLAQLEERFLALQHKHHPDKQLGKIKAMTEVLELSKAYIVLKSDVERARHMLQLVNVNPEEVSLSNTALIEAFEDREQLANLSSQDEVDEMATQIKEAIEQYKRDFSKCYSDGNFEAAALAMLRLRYKRKLLDEINAQ